MSWEIKGKPITTRATRKLIDEFVEMEPAPQDRALSERRMMVYERMLKAGSFRPVTWAKCYCNETETWYRVNGKHTANLLSRQKPLPVFTVVVESYVADSLTDVAQLYSTFDSRTMTRTSSDINACFAATVPELAAISRRKIDRAVSGISFHLWKEQASAKQIAERAELILDHVEFIIWFDGLLSAAEVPIGDRTMNVKKLERAPVIGAMLGTWMKSQRDSTDFWKAVRDETGDKPQCPDRKLAKYLTHTSIGAGRGATRGAESQRASRIEMYTKCIIAWNAWRRGGPTDLKFYPKSKPPVIT